MTLMICCPISKTTHMGINIHLNWVPAPVKDLFRKEEGEEVQRKLWNQGRKKDEELNDGTK